MGLMPKLFPPGFLWGASTAAHQIEGNNHNNWSVWEKQVALHQAQTAEQRLSYLPIWPEIKHQAESANNYRSGRGVQHYKYYKQDFKILSQLGLNSFRFSIEWSRIEPEEGVFDQQAIDHYRRYIKALKQQGIVPMLNLWHWTHPVWFEQAGGFAKRSNLSYFRRFLKAIADLIAEVDWVVTINEPNVYTAFSFLNGIWPPQKKNLFVALRVYRNLVRAHCQAYDYIKDTCPRVKVGVATHLVNVLPKRPHNLLDILSTKWVRYFWNWWFLNRIDAKQDFVGFNYYFTDYYKLFKRRNPTFPVNDLGWYMEPEGLHLLLSRVWSHYKKPIIITENGCADRNDQHRRWWLEETMIALERALSEGVDVSGYFHWSLLDNFEWAYGWWPQFGLVHVDRSTMARSTRKSALWWADWLKHQQ